MPLSIEGYYDIHLDQLDLTGSNLDAWNLLEFDLPNEFLQAMMDQNRRVSITFILNTSDNVGPYFLDNAIFK